MPNRQERHLAGKGLPDERIDISGIVVHFANGQYVNLDIGKAQVVDKFTGRPLFDEVLEAQPDQPQQSADNYAVEFETPEGTMIFSKNGDWSGVKKK